MTHRFVRTAEARPFGRFLASSLSSSIVDLAAFAALCALLEPAAGSTAAILAATVAARVLSSLCNYLINYFFVFHSRTRHGRSATLYTAVTVIKTAASAVLVAALAAVLPEAVRSWASRSRWTACCFSSTIWRRNGLCIERGGRQTVW